MIMSPDAAVIETYPGAQSAARAVALLKSFDDARPEWTLGELSERLGLNKTTTHRLLAVLEGEGLIERSNGGAYKLGPELIALGGCAMRANDLRSASRAVMEALAMEVAETVSLEILSKDQIMIIDEVSSREPMGVSQNVGARLPLHATSTGKLLLAYSPADVVDEALSSPLPALTPATVTDAETVRTQLDEIRARGYAITQEELDVGFMAVAAPIYDHTRTVVAALSIGGPILRMDTEELPEKVAALQVAARKISRGIGYQPG
jgi:DNA-binding IclR family transcriptional regulator